jgi:hypothetical protein
MAHSNSELLITAALDYNNALIQIDFADATPGNVSAEQADALYIYGNALG